MSIAQMLERRISAKQQEEILPSFNYGGNELPISGGAQARV